MDKCHNHRVLCIEDDEGVQSLITMRLEREGYQVDGSRSFQDGLKRAKEHPYSIILIDYHLPDGEGIDFLKQLHGADDERCFVMLTGMGSEEIIISAFHNGADYYLDKDSELKFLDLLPSVLTQCIEKIDLVREKKRFVEELQTKMDEAVRDNEKKDNFLTTMTHELKTPLYTITGYCECLSEEVYGPLTEKQKQVLAQMQKAAMFLNTVVSDLITMKMLERDKVKLEKKSFCLKETVQFCLDMVRDKAQDKGISIKLEYQLDPEFKLFADPDKMTQVLINLISNAIKYSEKGTVLVRVGQSDFLDIMVQDEGIGIDKENQKKIFEPYIQLPSIKGKRGEGSGLGLAITKRLIELHGGEIALESRLNEGTKIYVRLPVKTNQCVNC